MSAWRRARWPVLLALVPMLAAGILQPLSAETDGASADKVPTDARIERLREAIEREREALERERETRRSMEEELGRTRDELDRTREELEELRRETDPDPDAGD
ncbi:hypothetical protein [Halofilum ochraceum]|uniref:hypothetical protein n=1 Tax=Halofilum ochraceum TaxID=1611323 RepID=UPI0008D9CAF7|nr:hypothetical protein [Halofilum ochraceum]